MWSNFKLFTIAIAILELSVFTPTFAIDGKYDQTFYSNNHIEFYNPSTCSYGSSASTDSTGTMPSGLCCSTSGVSAVSGNGNEAKIWNWLISNGMSENGAAGIMGNMESESGFNPFRIQGIATLRTYTAMVGSDSSNNAFGLVQWDGSRRPAVLNYITSNGDASYEQYVSDQYGKGPSDYKNAPSTISDSFITLELQYVKKESTPGGGRSMVWNDLIQADSPGNAADIFNQEFEVSIRAAGGTQHNNAQKIYQQFHGTGTPPIAGVSDTSSVTADTSSSCNTQSNNLGMITQGGLTEDQAKQFVMNYGANKNNDSEKTVGESYWDECSGNGSNCVTFSRFFLNKFTSSKAPSPMGNGGEVVDHLKAIGVPTGNTPKVYAVFSWGGSASDGHTGVILGIHGNTIIVGEASCSATGAHGAGDGVTYGKGAAIIKVGRINDASVYFGTVPTEFAYPKDVNVNAIQEYVNGAS